MNIETTKTLWQDFDCQPQTTYYEVRARAPDGPVCIMPGNIPWAEARKIMGFGDWVATPIEKELAR